MVLRQYCFFTKQRHYRPTRTVVLSYVHCKYYVGVESRLFLNYLAKQLRNFDDEDKIKEIFAKTDFMITCMECFSPRLLHTINKVAIIVGKPWMSVLIDGSLAIIVPIYIPGEPFATVNLRFKLSPLCNILTSIHCVANILKKRKSLRLYFHRFYNNRRYHESLGYKTPSKVHYGMDINN